MTTREFLKKLRPSPVTAILIGLIIYVWFRPPAFVDELAQPAPAVPTVPGHTLADLRGKVVLVNFWATDCVTCIKEMPDITATYNKYRAQGFETIAVAMRHDPPNYVLNYVDKNKLPFTVALDPMGELAKAFGEVKLTPTTFVIDRQGKVVTRILGEPDFAKLHALLEEKLKET
jgi:peroxiredoxin